MKLELIKNKNNKIIDGPVVINPKVYEDNRGFFYESWNESNFISILSNEIIYAIVFCSRF